MAYSSLEQLNFNYTATSKDIPIVKQEKAKPLNNTNAKIGLAALFIIILIITGASLGIFIPTVLGAIFGIGMGALIGGGLGFSLVGFINKFTNESRNDPQMLNYAFLMLGGGTMGAGIGAVVGSAFGPVGTVVGLVVGFFGGFLIGGVVGLIGECYQNYKNPKLDISDFYMPGSYLSVNEQLINDSSYLNSITADLSSSSEINMPPPTTHYSHPITYGTRQEYTRKLLPDVAHREIRVDDNDSKSRNLTSSIPR